MNKTTKEIDRHMEDGNMRDDEITIDNLILSGFKLYQHKQEFRFSIDAVLLAHFGKVKRSKPYIDLGTGTSVIPHILVHRGAEHVVGLDINKRLIALSQQSVYLNGLENYISLYCEDYVNPREKELFGKFYGAFINPPYFKEGTGLASEDISIREALHEGRSDLESISKALKRYVQYGGYVWMIHRSERLGEIITTFEKEGISVKRLRFVHSFEYSESKLVLIEGRIGGKSGLVVESPLIIYESPGNYTKEVKSWYGIE